MFGLKLSSSKKLTILGVVCAAMVVSVYFSSSKLNKLQHLNTQAELEVIQDALSLYAMRYGRLPCPTSLEVREESKDYGHPAIECHPKADGDMVALGGVPFHALDLPSEFSKDAWDKRYIYRIDVRFTKAKASQKKGSLQVNDSYGNPITNEAIFVISSPKSPAVGLLENTLPSAEVEAPKDELVIWGTGLMQLSANF